MQQLTYRGARYNVFNHPVEVIQTSDEGSFRGSRYRIKRAKEIAPKKPSQRLSYRFAQYMA